MTYVIRRFFIVAVTCFALLGSLPVGASKIPRSVFRQWVWVGHCETHDNWTSQTLSYSGALGITRRNWDAYGGLRFAPTGGQATPIQQVLIAMRINRGFPVPDQPTGLYCNPRGW